MVAKSANSTFTHSGARSRRRVIAVAMPEGAFTADERTT